MPGVLVWGESEGAALGAEVGEGVSDGVGEGDKRGGASIVLWPIVIQTFSPASFSSSRKIW